MEYSDIFLGKHEVYGKTHNKIFKEAILPTIMTTSQKNKSLKKNSQKQSNPRHAMDAAEIGAKDGCW